MEQIRQRSFFFFCGFFFSQQTLESELTVPLPAWCFRKFENVVVFFFAFFVLK